MKSLIFFCVTVGFFCTGLFLGSHYYYLSPFHPTPQYATAVIHPTKGNSATGSVHFKQLKNGVQITAHITGLQAGKHGFHIHEFGDCNCDDALCAGDHFNPTHAQHGSPTNPHVHIGDLGNIVADEAGNGQYEAINQHIALSGPHSIIGRALIVHEKKDDLVSQPTGDAGARIGCGVIGISNK